MVRHGETTWHAENRYAGASDIPLTSLGREQAHRLAEWASTAGLSACWSSTLSRARDTLVPVAEVAELPAHHDERLCEVHFGDGEGRTAAEMRAAFGPAYAAFETDPVANHLPGGEHPEHGIKRATACLEEITAQYPDGRVLVVWHSTLMRLVLCRLIGIPVADYRRVFPTIGNVALTEVRLSRPPAALLQFNTPLTATPPDRRQQ